MSGTLTGDYVPIDFKKHAEAMGANVEGNYRNAAADRLVQDRLESSTVQDRNVHAIVDGLKIAVCGYRFAGNFGFDRAGSLYINVGESLYKSFGMPPGQSSKSLGNVTYLFHRSSFVTHEDVAVVFQACVAQVHTRMPVILSEEHHEKWLGEVEDGDLKELLKPHPADETGGEIPVARQVT
jgi:hypothetical protein